MPFPGRGLTVGQRRRPIRAVANVSSVSASPRLLPHQLPTARSNPLASRSALCGCSLHSPQISPTIKCRSRARLWWAHQSSLVCIRRSCRPHRAGNAPPMCRRQPGDVAVRAAEATISCASSVCADPGPTLAYGHQDLSLRTERTRIVAGQTLGFLSGPDPDRKVATWWGLWGRHGGIRDHGRFL